MTPTGSHTPTFPVQTRRLEAADSRLTELARLHADGVTLAVRSALAARLNQIAWASDDPGRDLPRGLLDLRDELHDLVDVEARAAWAEWVT